MKKISCAYIIGSTCLVVSMINSMPIVDAPAAPTPTTVAAAAVPAPAPAATPAAPVTPVVPETAAPAPTPPPAADQAPTTPTPATAPATSTPETAAPAVTPAAPATPTTAPVVQQISPEEINQLNGYFTAINDAKSDLKKLLTRMDDAVTSAKTMASQARKRSMEILKQKDDASAKAIIDEIVGSSESLKKTFADLSGSVNTDFQNGVNKIQTIITTMQQTLDQLKSKGVALQASHEAQETHEAKETLEAKRAPTEKITAEEHHMNWFIVDKAKEQKPEEKTMVHYVFNRVADFISEIARIIYATYEGVKTAWLGMGETSKPEQSVPPTLPPAQTAPVMPTT